LLPPDSTLHSQVIVTYLLEIQPHTASKQGIVSPDTEQQPLASTLNAPDGAIASNMAIVPNIDGTTGTFASNYTQLVLDISGYFAP
jgi:hypothetical protein